MSYVGKKTRLFNTIEEPPELPRKHSDGRLKSYNSATDTRAWSDISQEQRDYILDLVRRGDGKVTFIFQSTSIKFINKTLSYRALT